MVKNPLANAGDTREVLQSLVWEDHLEKEMATHFSILENEWTEEPDGPQSTGHQRVGCVHIHTYTHTRLLVTPFHGMHHSDATSLIKAQLITHSIMFLSYLL